GRSAAPPTSARRSSSSCAAPAERTPTSRPRAIQSRKSAECAWPNPPQLCLPSQMADVGTLCPTNDARQAGALVIDPVVFDLDGTLGDTSASCGVAWNRVLARHRIPFRSITEHDVRSVTGRPHEDCIRTVFAGLSEPHIATLAAETQTEDNQAIAELGGELFADVETGIRQLSARYPLYIVSNCQSGYIETFFRWTRLGGCVPGFA